MKKMTTTLLSVALASSLAAAPASAIALCGGMGAARAAVRAGMEQTLDPSGNEAMALPAIEVMDQEEREEAGRLEINEPGTYVLKGNLRGTVDVNPGAGDVTLVLDNVTIDGNRGPAIRAKSGGSLTIMMPEGSNSRVMSSGMGPDCKGTIQGNVSMMFEGPGALTVVGNSQPGIFTDNAPMAFGGGNFTFVGEGPGMQAGGTAPGNVVVNDGVFTSPMGKEMVAPGTNFMQNGGSFEQRETGTSTSASAIVTSEVANTAADLFEDLANATYYSVTNDNSQIKITDSGTYVVSGSATDGSITVKKGTTGVVLVLEDLDLTSTTGATLSVNKEAEVKIIVSGNVTLTDNENPADEESADEAVADAYDGAAIKVKAGSQVYLTGDGTLTINGNAKNGIKVGDEASLVIDGATLNITAANDGINANYDLTILDGDITIAAGDDAIHSDRILTIGDEETGEGPSINVTKSTEGLEGTVVNIFGGDVDVNSSDDAINAANADGAYEDELGYAINMTGGDVTIRSGGDGMDSNGDVNLVDGKATIRSANAGGEAGIDYDGNLYVSDEFELNNSSGVSGADMQPGQMTQPGQMSQPGQMQR